MVSAKRVFLVVKKQNKKLEVFIIDIPQMKVNFIWIKNLWIFVDIFVIVLILSLVYENEGNTILNICD